MAKVSLRQLPGAPTATVRIRRARPSGGGRRRGKRRGTSRAKRRSRGRKRKSGRRGGGALDVGKKKKLKQLLPLLKTLQDVRPHNNRSILLSHLDDETCEALYETIYNVLGNDKLDPAERKKLRRKLWAHQEPLNFLTKSGKKFSPKLKRKKLAAIGGNPLFAVLGAAIPLLIDVLTNKRKLF
jgi:hypothetical protein